MELHVGIPMTVNRGDHLGSLYLLTLYQIETAMEVETLKALSRGSIFMSMFVSNWATNQTSEFDIPDISR